MQPGPGNPPSRLPLRFRPPWWAILLAVFGCGMGVVLGNWQSGRAAEKRALAATLTNVTLRGEFIPRHTVLLDNKLHRGRTGYHVVQPMRLASGRHVLVNRGWAAAGATREQLPQVDTPAGEISLSGVRLEHFPRAYEPAGTKPSGSVWQNVSIEQFAAWSGLALEPYVVEQHPAQGGAGQSLPGDGLVRDWPRPGSGAEKHEMYALQWYSLAALSVILLLVLGSSREKPGR